MEPTLGYFKLRGLPYWIDGNVRLTETKAILRHIARTRLPSLLGITPHEMAEVEMLAEVLWDMWNSLCQICLKNDDSAKDDFLAVTKTKLQLLSKSYTKEWISGSNITIADFLLYELLYHLKLFSSSILNSFPKLEAFMMRFQSIPQIREYFTSKQYIKGPCFSDKFKSRL